jgi:hypothetical protein
MINTPSQEIPESSIRYIEKSPSKLKWALMIASPYACLPFHFSWVVILYRLTKWYAYWGKSY